MIVRFLALFATPFLLSACSSVRNPPRLVEAPQSVPGTQEERLAAALADAHRAAQAKDFAAMGQVLAWLDAIGVRPLDEGAETQIARWNKLRPANLPPMRGRALGPGFRSGFIAAGKSTQIEQTFLSGKKASIALSTASGDALELGVRSSEPKILCREEGPKAACSWTPVFTGRYSIEVTNPGKSRARYFLVIN